MLRLDKATYLSFLFNFILSVTVSISLRGSVLLFSEFINIVFILHYNCIEFIILLYAFFSNFIWLIQKIYDLTDFI